MRETVLLPQPGLLVRVLRKRKGLTLEQLAAEVGLSKGHLSRYERGEKSLSVSSLMRLAKVLGSSVSALLGEVPQADLVHLVRATDRPAAKTAPTAEGHYSFIPLSRPGNVHNSTVLITQLPSTSVASSDAYHGGEEMLFILSGCVELELVSRSILLRQGDFIQFPGTEKHRLTSMEEGTEVLIVVTNLD